jgi:hypothetical protein
MEKDEMEEEDFEDTEDKEDNEEAVEEPKTPPTPKKELPQIAVAIDGKFEAVVNTKKFKLNFVRSVRQLVDEAVLYIDGNGIELVAYDDTQTSLIHQTLYPKDFVSYAFAGQDRIKVGIDFKRTILVRYWNSTPTTKCRHWTSRGISR